MPRPTVTEIEIPDAAVSAIFLITATKDQPRINLKEKVFYLPDFWSSVPRHTDHFRSEEQWWRVEWSH